MEPANVSDTTEHGVMRIPEEHLKFAIGKRGATINLVQRKTQTRIQNMPNQTRILQDFAKQNPSTPQPVQEAVLFITGQAENIQVNKSIVNFFLHFEIDKKFWLCVTSFHFQEAKRMISEIISKKSSRTESILSGEIQKEVNVAL